MRGSDLRRLLEEQFERDPDVHLQASGLSFERDPDGVAAVTIAGRPLESSRVYTVAANTLLVERGGFVAFRAPRRLRPVGTDLEALVSLMRASDPSLDSRRGSSSARERLGTPGD